MLPRGVIERENQKDSFVHKIVHSNERKTMTDESISGEIQTTDLLFTIRHISSNATESCY